MQLIRERVNNSRKLNISLCLKFYHADVSLINFIINIHTEYTGYTYSTNKIIMKLITECVKTQRFYFFMTKCILPLIFSYLLKPVT